MPNGFGSDPAHAAICEAAGQRWTWRDVECEGDLLVVDLYPRMDLFPRTSGTLSDNWAPRHFEAAGRITGSVRLKGIDYKIDGLAYRDHSWGRRQWDTVLSHRWVVGTFGSQLSFAATTWHGTNGSMFKTGLVVQGGRVQFTNNVDIIVYLESDGLTHRGGEVALLLPSNEEIRIRARPIDGVLAMIHGIASIDQLCTVSHAGMQGFCDFEITNNPRNGRGPVLAALQTCNENGFSRRPESALR
jgi:hypothetical protein